jgi:hypothetical protein
MHNRQTRVFFCAFFITLSANNHSILGAEYNWHNYATKETIIASTLGTAATLLIGKKLYDIYTNHFLSNKNIIQHCRAMYKKIYAIIQHNNNAYQNDSQLSDWDLKESIYTQKKNSPYPFMAYHSSLTQSLYAIEQQMRTIKTQINDLHKRKNLLSTYGMQKNSCIIEILTRLEIQGHMLEALLYKAQSMIIMLKNRIALFKEYNNDYHNWIYEQNKKRQEKAQS